MERGRTTFKTVRIPVAGRYKAVRTVTGAGKLLLNQWAIEHGARRRATWAAVDASSEKASPAEVRQALPDAAAEAHLKYGA